MSWTRITDFLAKRRAELRDFRKAAAAGAVPQNARISALRRRPAAPEVPAKKGNQS